MLQVPQDLQVPQVLRVPRVPQVPQVLRVLQQQENSLVPLLVTLKLQVNKTAAFKPLINQFNTSTVMIDCHLNLSIS